MKTSFILKVLAILLCAIGTCFGLSLLHIPIQYSAGITIASGSCALVAYIFIDNPFKDK